MSNMIMKAEQKNGRTILTECCFSAPMKIARPFYHDDFTEVMVMSASAGFLEGDRYDISMSLTEHASLKLTGQSYTKVFRASQYGAVQNMKVTMKNNSTLACLLPPIIPFSGSMFRNQVEIHLECGCQLLLCEIISCGRIGMGERFAWKKLQTRTIVYQDDIPVFLDSQMLLPHHNSCSGIGFFEGHTHIGTIYTYGAEDAVLPDQFIASKTRAAKGMCIRILADSTEEILSCLSKINFTGGYLSWLAF